MAYVFSTFVAPWLIALAILICLVFRAVNLRNEERRLARQRTRRV